MILRLHLKVFPCLSETTGSISVIQNLGVLNKAVCISDREKLNDGLLLFTKQTAYFYTLDCKYSAF